MKNNVIIIEDDHAQQHALKERFTSSGFTVDSAGDGAEGLEKVLVQKPDGIVLDLVMPRLDGVGFLKKLREDEWGKNAKVVVLTNRDDTDAVSECMQYGVFQVFLKTDTELDTIVSRVREFLNS